MRFARHIRALALTSVFGFALASACTDGGVVGGDCIDGLTACGGVCLDTSSDPNNCGACGNECQGGVACVAGVCGGDGGVVPDSSLDGASDAPDDGYYDGNFPDRDTGADTGDGSTGDGSTGDGSTGDGSTGDGSTGDGGDGSTCKPPYDKPSQCGDCFTVCSGATPICSPVDGGYACVPLCTPPLVDCGGKCVDLNSDPLNCGACFNQCPSGICQAGQCVGALPGHVVVGCMDYQQSFQNAPQTVLLGNAVFIPIQDPVRILAYEQYTPPAVKNKVNQTIGWAASAKGRTYATTAVTDPAKVISDLNVLAYDVLLVYDQPNAPAGTLGNVGTSWTNTVTQFAKAGGTIVVLNGGQGTAEMGDLLTNSTLLPVSGQSNATGSFMYNKAPADAVGINVLSPFIGYKETCTLTTSASPSSSLVYVITNGADAGTGQPVVIHRIQVP